MKNVQVTNVLNVPQTFTLLKLENRENVKIRDMLEDSMAAVQSMFTQVSKNLETFAPLHLSASYS